MAGHVLGVILAGLVAFGFAYLMGRFIRQDAQESSRVLGMPSSVPEKAFLGASSSRPSAQLEFFDWGLRLSSGPHPFNGLTPIWEARYEELESAQLASSIYKDSGVRLAMRIIEDSVIFWSRQSAEVLDHLHAHGVVVERHPRKLWQEPDTYHSWPEREESQPAWWDWRTMPLPWPVSGRKNGVSEWGWRRIASLTVRLVVSAACWGGIMWFFFK